MKYEELELELKKNNFDYKPYIYLAITDIEIRKKLIRNITEDNHINIYYNSHYLIKEASKIKPELFYEYWDLLVPLLYHKNSYHRSISHWILTNLVKIDKDNKFGLIKDKYFAMIKDEKFLTGFMALKDIIIVSDYNNYLNDEVTNLFLDKSLIENYKESQISKFQYEMLLYFEKVHKDSKFKNEINNYITNCINSKNIKISKLAQKILNDIK